MALRHHAPRNWPTTLASLSRHIGQMSPFPASGLFGTAGTCHDRFRFSSDLDSRFVDRTARLQNTHRGLGTFDFTHWIHVCLFPRTCTPFDDSYRGRPCNIISTTPYLAKPRNAHAAVIGPGEDAPLLRVLGEEPCARLCRCICNRQDTRRNVSVNINSALRALTVWPSAGQFARSSISSSVPQRCQSWFLQSKRGSKRAVAKWLSCVSFTVIRFIQILQTAIFVSSWQVCRKQGWGYLFANRYCNTRIRPPRPLGTRQPARRQMTTGSSVCVLRDSRPLRSRPSLPCLACRVHDMLFPAKNSTWMTGRYRWVAHGCLGGMVIPFTAYCASRAAHGMGASVEALRGASRHEHNFARDNFHYNTTTFYASLIPQASQHSPILSQICSRHRFIDPTLRSVAAYSTGCASAADRRNHTDHSLKDVSRLPVDFVKTTGGNTLVSKSSIYRPMAPWGSLTLWNGLDIPRKEKNSLEDSLGR